MLSPSWSIAVTANVIIDVDGNIAFVPRLMMMETPSVRMSMIGSMRELVVKARMTSTTMPAATRYIHSSSNTVSYRAFACSVMPLIA